MSTKELLAEAMNLAPEERFALVGALLEEQTDERLVTRRYMNKETLARVACDMAGFSEGTESPSLAR